jgi:CysZ protein
VSTDRTLLAAPRPNHAVRTAEGAWHVFAGFAFLVRRPRLWPLALAPVMLAAACLVGGLFVGYLVARRVDSVLVPGPEKVPGWLQGVLTLTLWGGVLGAGVLLGLAVALLLAAPILERLSRRVEAIVRGRVEEASSGLRWEFGQSLKGALYFLAAAPGILILSFIPAVGPVFAAVWAGHVLAHQQTDAALSRRGLTFAERRAWHRERRPESLGFGLTGLLTLLVPLANLLVTPVLAVGGTLLVLDLEPSLPPIEDVPA